MQCSAGRQVVQVMQGDKKEEEEKEEKNEAKTKQNKKFSKEKVTSCRNGFYSISFKLCVK